MIKATSSEATETTNTKFEHWALVELMGHQRIAGLVSEVTLAGKGFVRVDVPDQNGETLFSRFYAPDAIYCVSPTDRQIAIGLAVKCGGRPVSIYDLSRLIADKRVGEGESQFAVTED